MNIQIILLIIGLIIVFFLAFKLLKGIIKAIITVVIISIILLGIFGVILYTDTMTLRKGFQGEKTIIITHNQELITAFRVIQDVSISSAIKQEFHEPLSQEELRNVSEKINNKEYEDIEEKGLLIIIDQQVFYGEKTTILEQEITMNQQLLDQFSQTKNTNEAILLLEKQPELQEQDLTILSSLEIHEFKSQVYYDLFMKKLKITKGKFLIQEIKNKNINTKPQLITIKILNFFPEKTMEKITKGE